MMGPSRPGARGMKEHVQAIRPALVLLAGLTLCSRTGSAAVRVSEIMYNPPQGSQYEYLEIQNDGAAVDLSGWAFTDGINFVFPQGTTIAAGGYLVVAGSRSSVLS